MTSALMADSCRSAFSSVYPWNDFVLYWLFWHIALLCCELQESHRLDLQGGCVFEHHLLLELLETQGSHRIGLQGGCY
jgi:hypothetical protein